jgi:hypothetical protein
VGRILVYLSLIDHLSATTSDLSVNEPQRLNIENQKIAIYTTYPDLINDPSEKFLLNALQENGYQVLIVANSVSGLSNKVWLKRRNRGYDLAAVRDAFRLLDGIPASFILVNSSIVWLEGTSQFIHSCETKLSRSKALVLSLTQSFQRHEHAQSFFFLVQEDGYSHLKNSFASMRNWRSKRATVNFGEIRLSKLLHDAQIPVIYYFPYDELLNYHKQSTNFEDPRPVVTRKFNPSQHFAKEIIENGGTFYKRNLKSTFQREP